MYDNTENVNMAAPSDSVFKDTIQTETKSHTIGELYALIRDLALNPNPIGQRDSTEEAAQSIKNEGIIRAIISGTGIGLLIFRDIVHEKALQALYNNVKMLVIDGGHRLRAIKNFIDGMFYVTIAGKKYFWEDLSDYDRKKILDYVVSVDVKVCTSEEAMRIFKDHGSATKINAYEMLMSDDVSEITEFVRKLYRSYAEYDYNKFHPIFETTFNNRVDEVGTYFEGSPNKRALWSTYVFTVLIKAIAGSNVDAGVKNAMDLVKRQYNSDQSLITPQVANTVNRFFDDLLKYKKVTGKKITIYEFGFFESVWFQLLSTYGLNGFKLNMEEFAKPFAQLRAALTGNTNKSPYYGLTIEDEDGDIANLRELIRKYVKAFSYGEKQSFAAKKILEEYKTNYRNRGIIEMHQRSVSRKTREELLELSGRRCYIDIKTDHCPLQGKELSLDDSVYGHDLAHSKGGKDGMVLCRHCNANMGTMRMNEYINYLNNRDFENEE